MNVRNVGVLFSDSLDYFYTFCLLVRFCYSEEIPWLSLSTYSLYQLQCFCPFTENFISIIKFFISKISKTFLFMGAISFYFSLRILIIYVPNSCSICSINSASLNVNFSISWGSYLSFMAFFKCLGVIGCVQLHI